jgi:phenylacetate-coenzyme A ligase PaaK-like adenylate-forming protein
MAIERGKYFDELETMPVIERDRYLNENLYKTIGYAYRNSALAKSIMDKAGVRPYQIRNMRDLELLPITRKNDLIEAQKATPPFGGLLAVPLQDVERVFISLDLSTSTSPRISNGLPALFVPPDSERAILWSILSPIICLRPAHFSMRG